MRIAIAKAAKFDRSVIAGDSPVERDARQILHDSAFEGSRGNSQRHAIRARVQSHRRRAHGVCALLYALADPSGRNAGRDKNAYQRKIGKVDRPPDCRALRNNRMGHEQPLLRL